MNPVAFAAAADFEVSDSEVVDSEAMDSEVQNTQIAYSETEGLVAVRSAAVNSETE